LKVLRDRERHSYLKSGTIAMSTNAMHSGPPAPKTSEASPADKKGFDDNRTPSVEIGEVRSPRGRILEGWKEWLVPPVVFPALLIIGIVAYAIIRT
jgi:hypothetical protein